MSERVNESKDLLNAIKKYHEKENTRIIGINVQSDNAVNFDRYASVTLKYEQHIKKGDKYIYGDIGGFDIPCELFYIGYDSENNEVRDYLRYYVLKDLFSDLLPILRIFCEMKDVQFNITVLECKETKKNYDYFNIDFNIFSIKEGKYLYSMDIKDSRKETVQVNFNKD